jgi:type VI secretion system secreted protein Hcp
VAIADMFLKMAGVTGEAGDEDHKGEIEVVSWSWGMESPTSITGQAKGKARLTELTVIKRVDISTPTLMTFLRNNKLTPTATLTVRKAGTKPLEYLKVDLTNVRVTAIKTDTQGPELLDRVQLGFTKIRVTYTPQQSGTGAKGGGDVQFEADADLGV